MAGSVPARSPEPRLVRADELDALLAIERRAGELLRGHEAHAVFAGHCLDLASLRAGLARGQLWRVEAQGEAVGYLLGGELDGAFHVLQMDVDPSHGRQGHGRRLLRHALARARAQGYREALLTTLADVPWNAPFYASEGFRPLPSGQWGPGLRQVMAEEAALGFPMHLRVAMWRPL
ncbi:GNAT family N-acetyltransferase [[Pseudomonas] boreopolis]|uniref:GNAT family N-acetyltransferase n=1 Tax=Xanthomonas boreopolis TaxID=86183 RepID=UPI003D9B91D8